MMAVVAVEEPPFLIAMKGDVGGVQVDDDLAGALGWASRKRSTSKRSAFPRS
jgi:hypothetical protein